MSIKNVSPEKNPEYIFSLTETELLSQIVKGEINPVALAKKQLANRGLDSSGDWIGFDAAEKHFDIQEPNNAKAKHIERNRAKEFWDNPMGLEEDNHIAG